MRRSVCLDRDVERGGRFVGDEKFRPACERHRDHDPLAHAARKLMRIVLDAPLGVGNSDHAERLDRAVARLVTAGMLMELDRFRDLAANREDRIQRRHRLLEDHRDPGAAHPAHFGFAQLQKIATLEDDRTAGDTRALGQQPHDREHAHRLAGAGLAHQPHEFAREG